MTVPGTEMVEQFECRCGAQWYIEAPARIVQLVGAEWRKAHSGPGHGPVEPPVVRPGQGDPPRI